MKTLSLIQTGAVLGLCTYLYIKLRSSWVPGIAGAVDGIMGTAFKGILVPSGPNAFAVQYWKEHGIDQAWFMEVARGTNPIPEYLKAFLPDSFTAGMLFNALFNWSQGTTVGDLEDWLKIGLPGSSDVLISNVYQYADAQDWRANETELIYEQLIEEGLWSVLL